MEIFIILLITAVIMFAIWIALGTHNNNNPKPSSVPPPHAQKEIIVETLEEDPEYIGGDFYTHIAGINYHANKKDVGAFVGIAVPEPENPHDENAIAIYRNDSRRLGYIGKDNLKDYHEWSKGKPFTCVGCIFLNNDMTLYGKVKVIKPYNAQYVEDETRRYLEWALDKYGTPFISDDLIKRYNL